MVIVYPYYGHILTMAFYKLKTRFSTQIRRLIYTKKNHKMGKGAIFLVQNNGDFNKKTLIEQHGYIVYTVYPYYVHILTMALYKPKTRFPT